MGYPYYCQKAYTRRRKVALGYWQARLVKLEAAKPKKDPDEAKADPSPGKTPHARWLDAKSFAKGQIDALEEKLGLKARHVPIPMSAEEDRIAAHGA